MTTAYVAFSLGAVLLVAAIQLMRSSYDRRLALCAIAVFSATSGILLVSRGGLLGSPDIQLLTELFVYQGLALAVMPAAVVRHRFLRRPR